MAERPASSVLATTSRALLDAVRWLGRLVRGHVVVIVGGPARARVIAIFGAVLALGGADASTVGAVAPQLEHALHIGNAKIGLLTSVSLLVGAIFVIPVGMLVDRVKRVPILAFSILLWSVASLVSAFAANYGDLLLTRLALGAVTATAGPAIASLTGDYFPPQERGRVYAYILGGETAGTAVGFIISGSVASAFSWRVAFVLLALPGFFLARTLWRTVPEPQRGGQSRLEAGALTFTDASGDDWLAADQAFPASEAEHVADLEAARRRGAEPDPSRVLRGDVQNMPLPAAVRYILTSPTNLMLIIGSSLGYFFFAGLQTFALLFVRGHYHVGQATSELCLGLLVLGALIGTVLSGQVTDYMQRRGILEARVWLPAICYFGAVIVFIPGILGKHLTPALWFDVAGATLIAAANPPLDAARLDIMPAGLWGRAESTRTFLRSMAQAVSPLAFGALADLVAGFVPEQTPVGTHAGIVSPSAATGLEVTFLLMLTSLAAAGVALARSSRTYAVDMATAAASAQAPRASTQSAAREAHSDEGSPEEAGPAP